ncbi:MAG: signal peptidase I [Actinobacteria bacterium]|nr:MAG: signal peptidase I [Actinomycetota bacterium]
MHDDDQALAVLTRTPADAPAFTGDLDGVVRRGRSLRRRKRAGRAAMAVALTVAVGAPLVWLGGHLAGSGGHAPVGAAPKKLIKYVMPSGSMDPTVKIGDVVLIDTYAFAFGRAPETGDVVLFRWRTDGQTFDLLKRVIGLPGESIEIRNGVVSIDGRRLVEPYLNRHDDLKDYGPFLVRPGHVFVLGDDRINSNDSRFGVGQVRFGDLIGKMVGLTNSAAGAIVPGAGTASSPSPVP